MSQLGEKFDHFFGKEESIPILSNHVPSDALDKHKDWVKPNSLSYPPSLSIKLSSWNPVRNKQLFQIGEQCGMLAASLSKVQDVEETSLCWTQAKPSLVEISSVHEDLVHCQKTFKSDLYLKLPEQLVHVDWCGDHILLEDASSDPNVLGFGSLACITRAKSIHALAHACAVMLVNQPDPLDACYPVIQGFHRHSPCTDPELQCLASCISFHLCMMQSVMDMAQTRQTWNQLDRNHIYYAFRHACGMKAHPNTEACYDWLKTHEIPLQTMVPSLVNAKECVEVDLSISSTWLGDTPFHDKELLAFQMSRRGKQHQHACAAGGHLEVRPYEHIERKEGNEGLEYYNVHIGSDFWLPPQTKIHCPLDGTVVHVLEHDTCPSAIVTVQHEPEDGVVFFTHFHYLSPCLVEVGDHVAQGDPLGSVASNTQDVPHLHMQIMLDPLAPSLITSKQVPVWSQICFDPHLLFDHAWVGKKAAAAHKSHILTNRKAHLGRGMSITYKEPLHIVRGDGAHLVDETGRMYLDLANNVAHCGHEHPRVVKAGQDQMAILNTNTRYLHENITSYAEKLLATFPPHLSVVHFVNSGSEANDLALRMAKVCTNAKETFTLAGAYHGNTTSTIKVSPYKFNGKGGSGPTKHIHMIPCPDPVRGLYRGEDSAIHYAKYVEKNLEELKQQQKPVAAFIAESILSCGGQVVPPKGFFKLVYDLIHEAGGLCIADEVQHGFGRVGRKFWGFELFDVQPDIVTVGKPMGNGHPLAAVICTAEVAQKFANGMEYFNTFGGNPVSCAIGREVLRVIQDEKLQEHALEVGEFLKKGLHALKNEHAVIGDVRGEGLFLGIELFDIDKKPLAFQADYIANRLKDLGMLIGVDGPDHNVLKIKPPMVFSQEHATLFLQGLSRILQENPAQLDFTQE